MTKFLDKFLEFKNEANATRKFALFAVVIITFGLISLSVTGIVATAHWTWLTMFPIIGLIVAVIGAELMSTVAFVRALAAPTLKRRIAGYLIAFGLAWVGVHNAENGVKVIRPDLFAESSASLAARAELAGEEAATLKTAQDAAIGGSGAELERVRTEIAELKTEQQLMTAMSPEGIAKAQKSLISQGLYFGVVDGLAEQKTESAMRARGEAITRELTTLKAREDGLMQGQASPVQAANTDRRLQQIDLWAKAQEAFWAAIWLAVMLWTLEGCRSLGLWALVTDVQGADIDLERKRAAELAELDHQNKLAAMRAGAAPTIISAPSYEDEKIIVPPPAAIPEPVETVSEKPAVDLQHMRNMALASAQVREARKVQDEMFIAVPSLVARDAALKVAAE